MEQWRETGNDTYYSHPVWLFIFLTIHERTRVIESDELAQKNRVSTMGVGAIVMVTLRGP